MDAYKSACFHPLRRTVKKICREISAISLICRSSFGFKFGFEILSFFAIDSPPAPCGWAKARAKNDTFSKCMLPELENPKNKQKSILSFSYAFSDWFYAVDIRPSKLVFLHSVHTVQIREPNVRPPNVCEKRSSEWDNQLPYIFRIFQVGQLAFSISVIFERGCVQISMFSSASTHCEKDMP